MLALRLLTRYRFHLVHAPVQEKSYFLAYLYLKPFATTFGAASRAIIKEFASTTSQGGLCLRPIIPCRTLTRNP